MKNALRLERVDFDNMENRDPIHVEILGTFVDDQNMMGKTAVTKIKEVLRAMSPVKIELGYDGNFYPQFRTVKCEVT